MGKQYETNVTMPVKYTNLPWSKVLVNPPPSRLNLTLKAQGFTLLIHKFGLTFSPIDINVRMFTDNTTVNNNLTGTLVPTVNYIPIIADQVNPKITITEISPETLFFHFDKLSEKRVNIEANFDVSFQDQFNFSDPIKFTPEQIIVSGPSSIVDTLTRIYTKKQNFYNLNTTVKRSISLEKIGQLEFSANKVDVEIPVSRTPQKR